MKENGSVGVQKGRRSVSVRCGSRQRWTAGSGSGVGVGSSASAPTPSGGSAASDQHKCAGGCRNVLKSAAAQQHACARPAPTLSTIPLGSLTVSRSHASTSSCSLLLCKIIGSASAGRLARLGGMAAIVRVIASAGTDRRHAGGAQLPPPGGACAIQVLPTRRRQRRFECQLAGLKEMHGLQPVWCSV